jgi:hypothetical protein
MEISSDRSLSRALGAVVAIFGLFVLGIVLAIALGPSQATGSAEVLAAAVALVGALVTAAVSAIGLVLKHSLDLRSNALQRETEVRKAALERESADRQQEAEDRLKLEAGIKAAQLFATTTGQPTPEIQRAAALFTLASLRLHDLTVSLVFGLFDSKEIHPIDAGDILERVFVSKDAYAKRLAMAYLHDRAEKLMTNKGLGVPSSLMGSPHAFDDYVRSFLPSLFGRILLSRPLAEWKSDSPSPVPLMLGLCLAYRDEQVPRLKQDAGAVLAPVLKAFPEWDALYPPEGPVELQTIRASLVTPPEPDSARAAAVVNRLQGWIYGAKTDSAQA